MYWCFLARMTQHCRRQPAKFWIGFILLLSGHHFIRYARHVADELERESREPAPATKAASSP
jgi:hypothetical protein